MAEIFSIPNCKSNSLASGEIFGWLLPRASETAPKIMVDNPSAVIGVDCKIMKAIATSVKPDKLKQTPSRVNELLIGFIIYTGKSILSLFQPVSKMAV